MEELMSEPGDADFGVIDGPTITFRRELCTDIDTAWRAISTKEALDSWFILTISDLKQGSYFAFDTNWSGVVTEVSPPNTIQFDSEEGGFTRFAVEDIGKGVVLFTLTDRMGPGLSPKVPTTDIRTNQPGGLGTHWSGVGSGWHSFADALVGYVEGRAMAFDYERMTEVYDTFLQEWWSTHAAPASSAG